MKRERTDLILGVLENAPTILFLGLWKTGFGLEAAGWSGCLAALAVLTGFRLLDRRADTIVLGININFVLTTPAIVGLVMLGQGDLARSAADHVGIGVIATVFLTGLALTFGSTRGFIGADGLTLGDRRRYSLLLLAVAGAGVAWSVLINGDHWLTIVLPLVALFTARRLILAHLADRRGDDGATPTLAAAALPVPEPDAG